MGNNIGFAKPNFKKAISKGIHKVDWKKAVAVAKVAGPLVAMTVPGAGPFVAAGLKVINAAESGDPKALAKVAAIQAAARSGDPSALAALQALKTAKSVKVSVEIQQQQQASGKKPVRPKR